MRTVVLLPPDSATAFLDGFEIRIVLNSYRLFFPLQFPLYPSLFSSSYRSIQRLDLSFPPQGDKEKGSPVPPKEGFLHPVMADGCLSSLLRRCLAVSSITFNLKDFISFSFVGRKIFGAIFFPSLWTADSPSLFLLGVVLDGRSFLIYPRPI